MTPLNRSHRDLSMLVAARDLKIAPSNRRTYGAVRACTIGKSPRNHANLICVANFTQTSLKYSSFKPANMIKNSKKS
uniref:Uncharacterized protein n=1 Tax=Romanomermis culicivorax TaxID=13658 RepID=A0A915HKR8_ROMCU